jgi:hypothetical protein
MKKDKKLQGGSSILIALVVIAIIIFILYHYGITFAAIWHAIKGFFGFN